MESSLQHSFDQMILAFRAERKFIQAGAGQAASGFKTDDTPITETDVEVERRVIESMQKAGIPVPIFGEESGYDDDSLPDTCWLVDPIDGTKSYIKNIPGYTCMAVLVSHGAALASIIYDPLTDTLYSAIKGEGARRNNEPLSLASVPLNLTLQCKPQIFDEMTRLFGPDNVKIIPAPSGAGYGFAQVLEGRSAARMHLHAGPNTHDHAPGALIISEAGGVIIPVMEDEYTLKTRSFIACHPAFEKLARNHLSEIKRFELPSQAL